MKIGEVSLLTNDVRRMADFYKFLLGVDNGSDDPDGNAVYMWQLNNKQ